MTDPQATDLVARLRDWQINGNGTSMRKLCGEAAAEIERLTGDFLQVHNNCIHARSVADKALKLLDDVRLDRMAPEWKRALVEVRELAQTVPALDVGAKP